MRLSVQALAIVGVLLGTPALAADPVKLVFERGWVRTVQNSGPSAERLDIVFVSEGYTASEVGEFEAVLARAMQAVTTVEPWSRYREFVNIFAVFGPSPRSGIADGDYTLFGTQSEKAREIIDGNPGLVERVVSAVLPGDADYDAIVVLVNDHDGRSVSFGTVAYVTDTDHTKEVTVHELGHSLGNLGDEYEEFELGYLEILLKWIQLNWIQPNRIHYALPNLVYLGKPAAKRWGDWEDPDDVPWQLWIEDNTVVPCADGVVEVGLFEGGGRYSERFYRPATQCRMRSSRGVAWFCPPCKEALVHDLYDRVDPVEASLRKLRQGEVVELSMTTIIPRAKIAWSWNGPGDAPPIQRRGGVLRVQVADCPPGATVQVQVWDPTPWVRKDKHRLHFEYTFHIRGLPRRRAGIIHVVAGPR